MVVSVHNLCMIYTEKVYFHYNSKIYYISHHIGISISVLKFGQAPLQMLNQ